MGKNSTGQQMGICRCMAIMGANVPRYGNGRFYFRTIVRNTFGNVELGNNHWFVLGCILVIYWIITILNLKFDMAKVGGNIGVWLGYISQ